MSVFKSIKKNNEVYTLKIKLLTDCFKIQYYDVVYRLTNSSSITLKDSDFRSLFVLNEFKSSISGKVTMEVFKWTQQRKQIIVS